MSSSTARDRWIAALLVAIPMGACSPEADAGPRATTRDSAGVRIVENTGTAGVESGWSVGPEPVFRTGWAEGDPQLQAVRSGLIADPGLVLVADQGASLLYGLSAGGAVRWSLGGPGEGPGEFGRLGTVIDLPGDSVLVSDGGNGRVTVFSGDEYAYDRRFERVFGTALYEPAARLTDGSFLLTPAGFALGLSAEAGWRSYPLFATTDFAAVDTLAVVPMLEMSASGDLDPLHHAGAVVPTGDRIATARSDRAEIAWRDATGAIVQIARWDETPRPVNESDWTRYEAAYRERMEGRIDPERLERNLRGMHDDFGGTLPLFRFVHGDDDGEVWLGEYRPADPVASVYRVVSGEGEWIGTVRFPRDIRILDITDTRVLGVELNELDVEAVVLYELQRSDGAG